MKKDFEKSKTALWKKWERDKGIRIPDDFRKKCEEAVGLVDEDVTLTDLNDYIEDRLEDVELLQIVKYFSNRKRPKVAATKHYQRCFEKRRYLVEFIMKRFLAITKRGHKSILDIYVQRLHKRIDWKQMCVEWNEKHPHDCMSPEVLKVRYYRAIAEEDIKREYLNRRFPTIMESIWERAGVPPYSAKLVFGEQEGKHNFRNDISVLTMIEELKAWQAETEWMFSSHHRELYRRRAHNERSHNQEV